jgi:iron complex outermembrane receptor protein
MKVTKKILLIGASASTIVLAAQASAQAVDAPAPAGITAASSQDIPSDPQPGEIVVTARRQALESATERKRTSDTIIDSVVADDAGKLPDNSITEVLQRVPGVTIVRFASVGDPDRFSVEGSGIQVRGLSSVLATLNGREIFGANGGGGISWGEVTPELMSAVDVYKASTADRIEGGIGGAVDLRTKMPFDFDKLTVSGTAQGGYGDASKKGSYGASFLATDSWQTPVGKFGVLVDIAYNKLNSLSSFVRAEPYYPRTIAGVQRYIPGGFDYGQEQFGRRREGLYGALQWQPTDNLRFFHTTFITNYRSDRSETSVFAVPSNTDSTLVPTPGSDAVYDDNGVLLKASSLTAASQANFTQGSLSSSGTANNQENETKDFSQGFSWDVTSKLKLSGALQFINSYSNANAESSSIGTTLGSFSFDATGDLPRFAALPAGSLSDRSSYIWQSFAYNPDRNRARDTTANLDLVWKVDDSFIREFDFGARYANRRERDNQIGTYWAALGRDWNGSPQQTLADGRASDTEFEGFSNFFKGNVGVPASVFIPSQSLLGTYNPILIQQLYGYDTGANPNGPNPVGNQDRIGLVQTRLRNEAVYAQARFGATGSLPVDGNIGLRVVRLKFDTTGNNIVTYPSFYLSQADANADLATGVSNNLVAANASTSAISASSEYTRYLPSFNINLHPTDQLVIRAAVTKTMSLPDFISTRASQTIGLTTGTNTNNTGSTSYSPVFTGYTATRGNPDLKPTMSLNLDLSAEYYQSSNLNMHVAVFHKRLDDEILYGNTLRPYTQTFKRADGTTTSVTSSIAANEVYNSSRPSFISGTEVGARKFFNELPSPLNGLGVEANYTYIDSKSPGALGRDIYGNLISNIPIVGLSKHNFNAQLLYERNPL